MSRQPTRSMGLPRVSQLLTRLPKPGYENGRTMRFMTEDQGATFLQVLQPTLGSSPYDMNPQEETWLQNEGEEYFNNMLNFYRHIKTSMREERHSHIFDLTRLFTDEKAWPSTHDIRTMRPMNSSRMQLWTSLFPVRQSSPELNTRPLRRALLTSNRVT